MSRDIPWETAMLEKTTAIAAGAANVTSTVLRDPVGPAANDNWAAAFALNSDTIKVHVTLDQKAFVTAGQAASAPTKNGAAYFPNIRIPIDVGPDDDTIFVKNAAAGVNVTTELTEYLSSS